MAQVESTVPVQALTVGGETLTGDETRVVRAPWDGAAIAAVPLVGATEARTAVAAATQAMRKPLPMCTTEVDPCYEHRSDELGCVNPEFHELPVGEPTFKVFARISPSA